MNLGKISQIYAIVKRAIQGRVFALRTLGVPKGFSSREEMEHLYNWHIMRSCEGYSGETARQTRSRRRLSAVAARRRFAR
jgi:hypothetical protein